MTGFAPSMQIGDAMGSRQGTVTGQVALGSRATMQGTVVFLCGSSWYLWNFRTNLAQALADSGYAVVFMAPEDPYSPRLEKFGTVEPIRLSRQGRNPFSETLAVLSILSRLRRHRGCPVLSWTPKANLYGGIAARVLGNPFFPNVAGLGFAFTRDDWLASIASRLYRLALRRARVVFFQNTDDLSALVASGAADKSRSVLLPGSGVDLDRFHYSDLPAAPPIVLLFAGRLIEQKGIRLLVDAVDRLRNEGKNVALRVVGFIDDGNPTALTAAEIDGWVRDGMIDYRGPTDAVEHEIAAAHCVVHPSWYREGRPRILMEAAACGRPAITTDSVGCRDAVRDGETGFLCKPGDVATLIAAIRRFLDLDPVRRRTMSLAARRLAEEEFDERIVLDHYRRALELT